MKVRRERHKLILFFKIVNGLLPTYLNTYLPPLVTDVNPYHRRRPLERRAPEFRTELYRSSFFPSTTDLWNNLPDNVKQLTSLSLFKRHLSSDVYVVPPYYYIGHQKSQIIHCKIRLSMSDLNNDLFNRHISENKNCTCGQEIEDAGHYLLACTMFTNARDVTIKTLPPIAINTETLLFGNANFSLALTTAFSM